jgi:hypothetical protein
MALFLSLLSFTILSFAQSASLTQDNAIATDGLIVGNMTSNFHIVVCVDNGTYGTSIEEVRYQLIREDIL